MSEEREDAEGVKPSSANKGVCKNGNGKTFNPIPSFDDKLSSLELGTRVACFAHRTPDPDAISSMMAMKWFIQKKYGLEVDLFFDGAVAHPQNAVLVNLLDPGMRHVDDSYEAASYSFNILVDTVPQNAGIGNGKVDFDVVIDHHREVPPNDYEGIFIHMKIGSCAAICFQIMKELLPKDNWFDDDVDADTKVATAMIAGIMTDTNNLLSDDSTEIDREAFSSLFEFRNSGFLHQIVYFPRPKFWIDKKAEAVVQYSQEESSVNADGFAVVGLGVIPSKERDLIADMAEEMVQWASVETAVAFAIVGGDRVEGSVRSVNPAQNIPDFCKKLGGRHGAGGGKHGKGAYRYDLSPEIDLDDSEAEIKEIWDGIKKRELRRIEKIIKK